MHDPTAMLDYEVEMGFILLEDIPSENLYNGQYAPRLDSL